jgi:hypothetical protein
MKIGREVSPKHGTMISLDDLRRALLLNWHFANPKLPFSLTFEPDEIDGRWM